MKATARGNGSPGASGTTKKSNERKGVDKRSLGRKNKVVTASWSRENISKLWSEHGNKVEQKDNSGEPLPFDACRLWTGSVQNGYPSLSRGHAQSKVKMHIVGAWTRYDRFPNSDEVVSHLCHRKRCINPDHLIIETISQNNARKGCLGYFVHDEGTESVKTFWCACPHDPKCLRSDQDNNGGFVPTIVQMEVDVSTQ